MRPTSVYLSLCFFGAALPYWQFLPWLSEHGLNLGFSFASSSSTGSVRPSGWMWLCLRSRYSCSSALRAAGVAFEDGGSPSLALFTVGGFARFTYVCLHARKT